jgi:Family of unknown function (DUF6152)
VPRGRGSGQPPFIRADLADLVRQRVWNGQPGGGAPAEVFDDCPAVAIASAPLKRRCGGQPLCSADATWELQVMDRRAFYAAALGAALLLPAAALAHHGWSWTTGENIELTGTITATSLGNPHGELTLDVDGTLWTVEVGQPWRNSRAGLEDGDLAEGVVLTVSGEPSADPDEKLLKVERLWIDGVLYELYPGRD